jgi:uncharacterized protein YjbJ (UPF0337 family)
MNTDQMKRNWKQFVGEAKEKWGKLADNSERPPPADSRLVPRPLS